MGNKFQTKVLLLIIFVLLLSACASKPSRFFVLNPINLKPSRAKTYSKLRIGLDEMSLPEYLQVPQLVTRENNNELKLDEFARWAEPLDKNITRVVKDNLHYYLPGSHIQVYPWTTSENLNYQIKIDISRFDVNYQGNSILQLSYTLLDGKGSKKLLTGHMKLSTHADVNNPNSIVASMNYNLRQLSQRLAKDIKRIS